ncbi:MAG: HAMP domain-containing protein [Methylobacter sp.]|nr:MAG: HAMP domain-containing protein [Methylobacter sp.]
MFINMKIGMRLGLGLCVMLPLMIVIIIAGISGMSAQDDKLDKIVNENNVKMALSNTMSKNVYIVSQVLHSIILLEDRTAIPEEKAKLDKARTAYNKAREDLEKFPANEQEKVILKAIDKAATDAHEANNKVLDLAFGDKHAEARTQLMTKAAPLVTKWQDALDDNLQRQTKNNITDAKAASKAYSESFSLMLTLGGIAIIMGIAITFWMTRSITLPLNIAMDTAKKIAEGDLTAKIEVTSTDETGQLLTAMRAIQDNHNNIIAEITNIVGAANNGDFSAKMNLNGKTGYAKELSELLNQLSDIVDTAFEDTIRVTKAMAHIRAHPTKSNQASTPAPTPSLRSLAKSVRSLQQQPPPTATSAPRWT